MTYLRFEQENITNLEYSLDRELLRTNQAGSYASTTIIGCNTRKYHGLLICPIDEFGGERFVLLSGLDETVIQHKKEFNLAVHRYRGDIYEPTGHKYIQNFEINKIPKIIYRVGGVLLSKEMLFAEQEEHYMIRYTLLEAHSPTTIRFRPFLAFRNIHSLTKSNLDAQTKVQKVKNGIKAKMYNGFPYLHLQFSKSNDFVTGPLWFYDFEYAKEIARGYDAHEDLFTPGFFEVDIAKGESIIFSASTKEIAPEGLKRKFESELEHRISLDSFKNCLINAANRFVVKRNNKTEIIAGYPWFGSWGRDTFISLPGLTLAKGDEKTFMAVLDTMVGKMKDGLFPNVEGAENAFNSVDAPLWFFWDLQQLYEYNGYPELWEKYSKTIKSILQGFKDGLPFNIKMHDNGLIFAGETGKALTWMDAVIDGIPVTARIGYAVEINALWYNAVIFSLELAKKAGDKKFVSDWESLPARIAESFINTFCDDRHDYLADYVCGDYKDWAVRPNMVFATSLAYSPIDQEMKASVIAKIEEELLTPRGLRTLSPKHELYEGIYEGPQEKRDRAYHQGTVWPWLLGHYCEGYLKLHKKSGLAYVRKLIDGFEEVMTEHGIGSISEVYDGIPPHTGRGTIAQAWSVSEILRIMIMIENYKG